MHFASTVPPLSEAMFLFFSNKTGCLGSLLISVVLSLIVILVMRGCSGVF